MRTESYLKSSDGAIESARLRESFEANAKVDFLTRQKFLTSVSL